MIVDIIVLAVLLISALIAFLRGFIREVLTIFGTLGALVAAYGGGPMLSPYIKDWLGVVEGEAPKKLFGVLPYTLLGDVLAYGSIFIVVVVLLSLVSHLIAETVKSLGLGAIDRTLGVIFGIARGAVLLGLLYMPVHVLVGDETKEGWFEGSKTHFYIEKTSAAMSRYLPGFSEEELQEKVEEGAASTRGKLMDMGVLPQDKVPEGEGGADKNSNGYTEEFRDNMDKLFEQKSDNNKERKLNE